uniref:Uncharacterized protein n=1 Tax=Eutreptiella gymnastica TaxID=73025 RepID=A0A7S1IQ43_9EUGL
MTSSLSRQREQRLQSRGPLLMAGPGAAPVPGTSYRVEQLETENESLRTESRQLQQEFARQREAFEAANWAMMQERATTEGCEQEISNLMAQMQDMEAEMQRRVEAEQHAMEQAETCLLQLQEELQGLSIEHKELQVENQHLRRMLQKRDEKVMNELTLREQQHNAEVLELAQVLEQSVAQVEYTDRDLGITAAEKQHLQTEVALLKDHLRASMRDGHLQLEDAQRVAEAQMVQQEREFRAMLLHRDSEVHRLEEELRVAQLNSRPDLDEKLYSLTDALERKTMDSARLLDTIREQRQQLDMLQGRLADDVLGGGTVLGRGNALVEGQARLLEQKDEEIAQLRKLDIAKDHQLQLLQNELQRLNKGVDVVGRYPLVAGLSDAEVLSLMPHT